MTKQEIQEIKKKIKEVEGKIDELQKYKNNNPNDNDVLHFRQTVIGIRDEITSIEENPNEETFYSAQEYIGRLDDIIECINDEM